MRVLLLSPVVREKRPDTDLDSVVTALLGALRADPERVVLHQAVENVAEIEQAVQAHRPDIVFNACETLEDKTDSEPLVPLTLERLGVPFTGSSSACLLRCLHKTEASDVLRAAGVPVPETYRPDDVPAAAYPVIVKPEHEDGSVGIGADSVAYDEDGLRRVVSRLLGDGQPPIVQRYVDGREVALAFLGWPEPRVLPPGEILYDREAFAGRARILTYASKWDDRSVDYQCTKSVAAELDPDLFERLATIARQAANALGMCDYGRVDFRIDASGAPFVIDLNPNCDLSTDGGFMLAVSRAGLDYRKGIEAILAGASARGLGAR